MQSWLWGELLVTEGRKITRLAYRSGPELLGVLTVEENVSYLGKYYYAPKGPILKLDTGEASNFNSFNFIKEFEELSRPKKIIFLRFEPSVDFLNGLNLNNLPFESDSLKLKSKLGIKLIKTKDIQPAKTLWLNLDKPSEQILAGMHPKTRYNIRLAEKKGVIVRAGGIADWPAFWELMATTAGRDRFRLHSPAHYKKFLNYPDFIKLFVAEYQGQIIAVGLFSYFANTVTYLHGASANSERNLMAPYLLQWEVIKRAQADGYKYYDFYGIDEKKWPGVTRFKLGFGGEVAAYPGTYDLVFRPTAYRLYTLLRRIKKII
ncbi:MAG: peptidoglycan bridge formation glycyltransferase FemA/FemB family protein [Candidatus Falkowbacteria bacterium]|nr:peptidoglycan bridge formation glycyltransferase FemA/FemB family protein [Candidatus Falkowbacteria bacterium]